MPFKEHDTPDARPLVLSNHRRRITRGLVLVGLVSSVGLVAFAQEPAADQSPPATRPSHADGYRNDVAADWIAVERDDRDTAAEALQPTVVELLALYLDAKQSHWNLQGPEFYQLHELYQEIADDMLQLSDRVAERQRQVGIPTDGRAETIAQTADLGGFPAGELAGHATLDELGQRFFTVGQRLRQRIKDVEDADPVTSNILQDTSERIDYWTWFLRAHQVQPAPGQGAAGGNDAGAKPGATTDQPGAGNRGQDTGRATGGGD